jgi:hypothetical protein
VPHLPAQALMSLHVAQVLEGVGAPPSAGAGALPPSFRVGDGDGESHVPPLPAGQVFELQASVSTLQLAVVHLSQAAPKPVMQSLRQDFMVQVITAVKAACAPEHPLALQVFTQSRLVPQLPAHLVIAWQVQAVEVQLSSPPVVALIGAVPSSACQGSEQAEPARQESASRMRAPFIRPPGPWTKQAACQRAPAANPPEVVAF